MSTNDQSGSGRAGIPASIPPVGATPFGGQDLAFRTALATVVDNPLVRRDPVSSSLVAAMTRDPDPATFAMLAEELAARIGDVAIDHFGVRRPGAAVAVPAGADEDDPPMRTVLRL